MSNIDKVIRSSNLQEISNPLSGDCATVATAIKDVFGGELICLYSSPDNNDNELPAHVVTRVDNELYDGSGRLTKQDLFEIHLVINGELDGSENPDKYICAEAPPEYMIDENLREQVQNLLEEQLN